MVTVPIEIAFHNIDSTPWAEKEIRARIAKLERIYERLTTCRVRVDQRAKNPRQVPPVVRIEMGIPGRRDLVVAHEPEHLQQKFQNPDLRNAISEAFRIAEDQLSAYKEQLDDRGREAMHETATQTLGQVAEINPEQDFGFILCNDGALLYFHRNSVLTGDFDALKRGDAVHYIREMGDTGPTASKVRVKQNSNAERAPA